MQQTVQAQEREASADQKYLATRKRQHNLKKVFQVEEFKQCYISNSRTRVSSFLLRCQASQRSTGHDKFSITKEELVRYDKNE